MSTVNVGQFNLLRVDRKVDFGFYMDDGEEGILLPKRFVPQVCKLEIRLVFSFTMILIIV